MSGGPGDTGWQSPFTESKPNEKAVRAKKVRNGLIVLAIIAAVAFAAGWNPPTRTVHKFTKASDYKPERESGCTNSGKGCHGSEKTYSDFNVYHPNAKCTTCHDYQGVGCIPCHMPPETECQLCHDGSLKQAPDVSKITDPYPRGHYRETTHTAMGTVMTKKMRGAVGGKASAKCADCHSRDLRKAHTAVPAVEGSTYGEDVGCGECHNDVRSYGLAEVLSDWKKRSCESCHRPDSSTPQHAINIATEVDAKSPFGCGSTGAGCHDVNELHALHKDEPKTCAGSAERGEKGCHVLGKEADVPEGVTCGGPGDGACHRNYNNRSYSHKRDSEVHSPTNSNPASDASFFDTPCGDCHRMAPDGTSLNDEHAIPTSEKTEEPNNVCLNCHNNAASLDVVKDRWLARNTPQSCSVCHGAEGLSAAHEGNLTAKHVFTSVGCSDTGAGCHPTNDYMDIGEPTTSTNIHRDCLRCHDWTASDGNLAYDPDKTTCGEGRDCHATAGAYDPRTDVHNGSAGTADGIDSAHHTAGASQAKALNDDPATGLKTACSACHSAVLGTEHARSGNSLNSGSGTVCTRCHNADETASELVKSDWAAKNGAQACASCHTSQGPRAVHGSVESSHAATELAPDGTAKAGACERSGCHATLDLRVLHEKSGCTAKGCHSNVGSIFGSGLTSCGGPDSNVACHVGYSADKHSEEFSHVAIELAPDGTPQAGACVRSGCHTTLDLRVLHEKPGCATTGCHSTAGGFSDSELKSCGGPDSTVACHVGYSGDQHFANHMANLSGTVNGVTYGIGENVGCFGCHVADLRVEHENARQAGQLDGGGSSVCAICHDDVTGAGNFAGLSAVKAAIANRDKRCSACHASGSNNDGPSAVASAHKEISTQNPLPSGKVWSDPFLDWKAAFDAVTGSGHNGLPRALVGGATDKRFPLTHFSIEGTTYVWALTPNSGSTTWLNASAFPPGSTDTTESIQHIQVTCDDCHSLPDGMNGPHGSAVPIAIDPAYSQTEYANPTRTESQFEATGTMRVVCFKCHPMYVGGIEGTTTPGGAALHRRHIKHPNLPATSKQYNGEACVDCHVRIPHAWKRPRLLIRTVVTTDGATPDAFPYVLSGHDGLLGIRLRSFDPQTQLRSGSCVTGGCHPASSPTRHPRPSDVPTATYWP